MSFVRLAGSLMHGRLDWSRLVAAVVFVALQAGAVSAVCGNGAIEAGEACDDGNEETRGWCAADCSMTQGPPLTLYAAGYDGSVYAVDVRTRAVIATIPGVVSGHLVNLQASPNGRYVATIDRDNRRAVLIDTRTNTVAGTVSFAPYSVEEEALAFSPDSERLYLLNGDYLLMELSVGSMSLERTIDTYANCDLGVSDGSPQAIAVSGDGRTAFLVTDFAAVLIAVDLETRALTCRLFGDPGFEEYPDSDHVSFVLSRDNRKIFATFDYSYTWFSELDVARGSYRTLYEQDHEATTLQLTCDEQDLYVVLEDEFVRVDPGTLALTRGPHSPYLGNYARFSDVSRDGGTFFWSDPQSSAPYWIDTKTHVVSTFDLGVGIDGIALVTGPIHTPLCSYTPRTDCVTGFANASLLVNETTGGREKVLARMGRGPAVTQAQFGSPMDPPCGSTEYALCLYDGAGFLAGSIKVDRAGDRCSGGDRMCWSSPGGRPPAGKGFAYRDGDNRADGVSKLLMRAGGDGKSRILLKAENNSALGQNELPTGLAAELGQAASAGSATMQFVTSDAACFSSVLPSTRRADSSVFKALQ